MKYKNILIGSIIAIAVTSCNSLDIPPMNIIQDTDVFRSEAGVTAYIARLYTELPIEDFKFGRDFDQFANYPSLCNATNEALLVILLVTGFKPGNMDQLEILIIL